MENFYYAQYDFKPKINEISRLVGKDHNIEELTKVKPKRPITEVQVSNILKASGIHTGQRITRHPSSKIKNK